MTNEPYTGTATLLHYTQPKPSRSRRLYNAIRHPVFTYLMHRDGCITYHFNDK